MVAGPLGSSGGGGKDGLQPEKGQRIDLQKYSCKNLPPTLEKSRGRPCSHLFVLFFNVNHSCHSAGTLSCAGMFPAWFYPKLRVHKAKLTLKSKHRLQTGFNLCRLT